jgi:hypothetical protein
MGSRLILAKPALINGGWKSCPGTRERDFTTGWSARNGDRKGGKRHKAELRPEDSHSAGLNLLQYPENVIKAG